MYLWGDDRRFNSYVNYFRSQFGGRVQKLSINAGFTCPNRDGSVGHGGCIFCNNEGFNPSYCDSEKSISQQLQEGIEFHQKRYKKTKGFLAYFQAYSNTYGKIDELERKYKEALNTPGVLGLVIGTRPDCINDDILELLKGYSKEYYIIVEYGVESCYDRTLELINRGHTFEQSVEAIENTASKGIKTGAHIIFGLPGENKTDMMDEAKILSKLPLNNIKFHQIQIMKNTLLADLYNQKKYECHFFDIDEYIDFMVGFIEQLNPNFVIERIAGEAPPINNLTPIRWNLRNDVLLNRFENKLEKKDTWQGRLYQ